MENLKAQAYSGRIKLPEADLTREIWGSPRDIVTLGTLLGSNHSCLGCKAWCPLKRVMSALNLLLVYSIKNGRLLSFSENTCDHFISHEFNANICGLSLWLII